MQATTPTTTTDDDDRTDSNPFRDALVRATDGDVVADPTPRLDHYDVLLESRHDRPLASDDHVGTMAGPAHDCGCDGEFCEAMAANLDVSETCDDPTVPTMDFATTTFERLLKSGYKQEGLSLERAKGQYARLLYGDRRLQEQYDDVTTVLLTFRLSPMTDECRLRPPLVMHDQLAGTWTKVYQRLSGRYGILDGYDYEYVRVYSGTQTFATPHMHVLIHADDPNDELQPNDFQRAVTAHTDEYGHARSRDHVVFADGDDGAVRLSHDPPVADDTERDRATRLIWSGEMGPHREATRAAMYLGTQIPRLLVAPIVEDGKDVPTWKRHTATWGWASPKDTVGFSRGWPDE